MPALILNTYFLKLGSNLPHNRPQDLVTKLRVTSLTAQGKPHGHVNVEYPPPLLPHFIH